MNLRTFFLFLCLIIICTGCAENSGQSSSIESQAEQALRNFYDLLHQGQYEQADDLYGGSYEVLHEYNPEIDEKDHESLLRAACEVNGFQCLDVLSVTLLDVVKEQEFIYEVAFSNPDGSQFSLGNCCGEDDDVKNAQSMFKVHIACIEREDCLVMELPPYVP